LSLQLQLFSVILRRNCQAQERNVILNKCVHVSQHISVHLKTSCVWSVYNAVCVCCLCVQSAPYKKFT